jgi:hypothetical protein
VLTVADFRRALDEAPELWYIDRAWPVYEEYWLVYGESEASVCAPRFLDLERSVGPNRHLKANAVRDAKPEQELWEGLQEYFLGRFRGAAKDEFETFFVEFFRRSDEAVDDTGRRRLKEWLKAKYPDLDEEIVDRLFDAAAEIFDEVDEYTADWLSHLRREAFNVFRAGGQEAMFDRLRELCKGVDERRLEQLFIAMRSDLERGATVVEALGRLVSVDEVGLVSPGPLIQQVLFEKKQDGFKGFKSDLDGLTDYMNGRRPFYPLSSARLFLDFARLGERDITEEDVMGWVRDRGILGLGLQGFSGDVRSECRGGPAETISGFAHEAKEANLLKRTYEAALLLDSDDKEVVEGAIRELREIFDSSEYYRPSPSEWKEKALDAVRLQVQNNLDRHCFIRWRRAGDGLVEFLDFRTVVGAMYLQFAWVLRGSSDVRRCRYCGKPVGSRLDGEERQAGEPKKKKTYKNKRFCNDRCRDAYKNERRRRTVGDEPLKISVPSTTREEIERLATVRAISTDALLQEMVRVYKECREAGS